MIEVSESLSAEILPSSDKEPSIAVTWNGHSIANVGNEQAQLGNALEDIRRQLAIQGPGPLENFDNCLITFIAFDPHPGAPLTTRIADLKKFMLASQIDPRLVDLIKI